MRTKSSAIRFAIAFFLGLAAMLPAQAPAQIYRPYAFERSENAAQLELEVPLEGFGAFGDQLPGSQRRAQKERQAESWTMFGRLGIVNVENQDGNPDDGFTLKRSGPGLGGRLTFGFRRRF